MARRFPRLLWRPAQQVGAFAGRAAGLLVGGVVLSGSALAQVYVGESATGTLVLSYNQSADTPDLLLNAPVEPSAGATSATAPAGIDPRAPGRPPHIPALPLRYKSLIIKVAREQQVPAPLIAAVAAAESGFDARARSPKGALGLMQLMPETARRFQVTDRLSAEQSVRGGAAYLKWLSVYFDRDLHRVIAAYNAGENAVVQAAGVPPFAETQAYLPRVLAYMRHFAKEFAGTPG